MSHDHGHAHHHHHEVPTSMTGTLMAGIVLNMLFVLLEAATGFWLHSLSLLSDAAHNLADVGTLAMAWLAFRLMKVKPSAHYTYGYRKTSILVALFNSVILLVSVGGILFEAARKFMHPEPIEGISVALVAGVGIVINGATAWLLLRQDQKDVNVRGAYLHMLSDALLSAVVVGGGLIMYTMAWYWVDPLLSVLVALFILISTWKLLRESLRLSLDGVPKDIEVEDIRRIAMAIKGITDLHHIHVWALSSSQNAMTAHLVIEEQATHEDERRIKASFRHAMEHQNIQHITLETERANEPCTVDC